MKLAQLSGAEPSTPKLVQTNQRTRKPTNRSEPVQNKLKNNSAAVFGANSRSLKDFISTVIEERIGPMRSIEDDLSEIFSDSSFNV
jgi:hypothetical protein